MTDFKMGITFNILLAVLSVSNDFEFLCCDFMSSDLVGNDLDVNRLFVDHSKTMFPRSFTYM